MGVAAGDDSSLAIDASGAVWMWGGGDKRLNGRSGGFASSSLLQYRLPRLVYGIEEYTITNATLGKHYSALWGSKQEDALLVFMFCGFAQVLSTLYPFAFCLSLSIELHILQVAEPDSCVPLEPSPEYIAELSGETMIPTLNRLASPSLLFLVKNERSPSSILGIDVQQAENISVRHSQVARY